MRKYPSDIFCSKSTTKLILTQAYLMPENFYRKVRMLYTMSYLTLNPKLQSIIQNSKKKSTDFTAKFQPNTVKPNSEQNGVTQRDCRQVGNISLPDKRDSFRQRLGERQPAQTAGQAKQAEPLRQQPERQRSRTKNSSVGPQIKDKPEKKKLNYAPKLTEKTSKSHLKPQELHTQFSMSRASNKPSSYCIDSNSEVQVSLCQEQEFKNSAALKTKTSRKTSNNSNFYLAFSDVDQVCESQAPQQVRQNDEVWFTEVQKKQLKYERDEELARKKKMIQQQGIITQPPFSHHRFRRKIPQNRKVFKKQEIQQLISQFEIIHNHFVDDEQYLDQCRGGDVPKEPHLTLPKLAKKYQCASASMLGLYKEWKYDPTLSKVLNRFNRQFKVQQKGKPRIIKARQKTTVRIKQLQQILKQNPFLQHQEMIVALRQYDPLQNGQVVMSVVQRLLKLGDFHKKKLKYLTKQRNSAENVQLRRQYALKVKEIIIEGRPILFYDELLINEHFDKAYGWARGDAQVTYKPQKFINSSIVIIGMLSQKGKLLWDAKYGDYQHHQYQGTILRFLKNSPPSKKKGIIIAVSKPYRDLNQFYNLVKDLNWEVMKIPTTGMQLSPLYLYFAQLRQSLKSFKFESVQTFFNQVVNLLQKNDNAKYGSSFTNRLDLYIKKAIDRQPF